MPFSVQTGLHNKLIVTSLPCNDLKCLLKLTHKITFIINFKCLIDCYLVIVIYKFILQEFLFHCLPSYKYLVRCPVRV